MSEEWKCRRFERGLRHNLLKALIHLKIKGFSELVEEALVAERVEGESQNRVMRTQKDRQEKPYSRPQYFNKETLKCFECGGDHLRRNCPKLITGRSDEKKCYKCHKLGHIASSCPEKNTTRWIPLQHNLSRNKTKAIGRVFTVMGSDAKKKEDSHDECVLE